MFCSWINDQLATVNDHMELLDARIITMSGDATGALYSASLDLACHLKRANSVTVVQLGTESFKYRLLTIDKASMHACEEDHKNCEPGLILDYDHFDCQAVAESGRL